MSVEQNTGFILITKKGDESFINELVTTFSEIKDEVLDEDWTGLIHVQVGCFTRFTQKAIDGNDLSVALKCFKFVENVIDEVESKIKLALEVSWVFHLSFINNEKLYEKFPSDLKKIRILYQEREENALKKYMEDNGHFLS